MGLKLRLLDLWMPKQLIYRELDIVASTTTDALKEALKNSANNPSPADSVESIYLTGSLDERRKIIARQHTVLVDALVAAVGKDEALKIGREALFGAGQVLGADIRNRLGIRDPLDLEKAAYVLYRVLGIDIDFQWLGETKAVLTVHRCPLSNVYSEFTCQVLSATDEGAIRGLVPNATMEFTDKITGGHKFCTAQITITKGEAK
jgi:predicted ArsR family transcriptional regulator